MSLSNMFYNLIVKRNSIFVGTILTGAFAFGLSFNSAADRYWEWNNQGRLWKDIRAKYVKPDEDDGDE